MRRLAAMTIGCFLGLALAVQAGPTTVNYQGVLVDGGGVPVAGTLSVTFSLYDLPAGGEPLWTETQEVTAAAGQYRVELGRTAPLTTAHFADTRYLGVTIAGEELLPRQEISSVPTALVAETARSVPWAGVLDLPADLADGDDVGLLAETDPTVNGLAKAPLACGAGQVARFNGSAWQCAAVVAAEVDPTANALAKASLSCREGQLVRFDGSAWRCATDLSAPVGRDILLARLLVADGALFDSDNVRGDVYTLVGDSLRVTTPELSTPDVDQLILRHEISESIPSYFKGWFDSIRSTGNVAPATVSLLISAEGVKGGGMIRINLLHAFPTAISRGVTPSSDEPAVDAKMVETVRLTVSSIEIVPLDYQPVIFSEFTAAAYEQNSPANLLFDLNIDWFGDTGEELVYAPWVDPFGNPTIDYKPGRLVFKQAYFSAPYWAWASQALTGTGPPKADFILVTLNGVGYPTGRYTYQGCWPTVHSGLRLDGGLLTFGQVQFDCESVQY